MNKKNVIIFLSGVIFLLMLGFSMNTPILPLYSKMLGATNILVGLIISIYGLVRTPLNIPFSVLFAKKNPFITAIIGTLFISISALILFFSNLILHLFLAKIFEGIGFLFYILSALRINSEFTEKKERGELMGIYVTSLSLGISLGPFLGGFITENFGFKLVFLTYFILSIISFIILFLMYKKTPYINPYSNHTIFNLKKLKNSIKNKPIIFVSIAISSIFIIRIALTSVLIPIYVQESFKLGETFIGYLVTLIGIAGMITVYPSGKISDKVGRKPMLLICLFLTSLVILLIPISKETFALQISVLIFGLSLGLAGPFVAFIADLSTKEQLPITLGIYRTFTDSGFFFGPLLGGIILEFFEVSIYSFLILSLILLISFVLVLNIKESIKYQ